MAIAQVAHVIAAEPDWRALWVALGLFIVLWWTGIGYAVFYNRYGDDSSLWQRLALIAATIPCGLAAVTVPAIAHGDSRRRPASRPGMIPPARGVEWRWLSIGGRSDWLSLRTPPPMTAGRLSQAMEHRAGGRFGGPLPYPTRIARAWRSFGAAFVVLAFAPPLVLLVSGSLRQPGVPPPQTPELFPTEVTTEAYATALEVGGLLRASVNSLIVAAVAVPVSVLVASLAGFALTRVSRRIAGVIVAASLCALMIPATALLVPKFAVFRAIGWNDTLLPLMAPALIGTSPLYPLVYYLAFRAVPSELFDVCRMEDLSPLRTWWRVAMPLVRPVTAAIAAVTFVITWSNFLDPLVFVYDRDLFTLPLALRSLATLDSTNVPVFLAAAALATAPALVVFALAQRTLLRPYGRTRG